MVVHARTSSPSHRSNSLVSRSPDPEDTRGEDRGRSLPSQEKPVSKKAGRVHIVINSLKETPWMMLELLGEGNFAGKAPSGERQFSWGREEARPGGKEVGW